MGIDVSMLADGITVDSMDKYKDMDLNGASGYLRNPIWSFSEHYPDEFDVDFFKFTLKFIDDIRDRIKSLDKFLEKYPYNREAIADERFQQCNRFNPGDAYNAATDMHYILTDNRIIYKWKEDLGNEANPQPTLEYLDSVKTALQNYFEENPDEEYLIQKSIEIIIFLRLGCELQLTGKHMSILYA